MPLTTTLRRALQASGKTAYRLHHDLGQRVSINTLTRIMDGETTDREQTIDALCELLGLELRERKAKR